MRAGPCQRKPISTLRRPRERFAWLAALTMTVLAVSPLLAIFHQISARHAVCEHGQLVESEHRGTSDGWRTGGELTLGDAEREPASDVRPDSAANRHGHIHCSIGTLAKSSVGLVDSNQVVSLLPELVVGGAYPDGFCCARLVLLAAPKTSPPRAAS